MRYAVLILLALTSCKCGEDGAGSSRPGPLEAGTSSGAGELSARDSADPTPDGGLLHEDLPATVCAAQGMIVHKDGGYLLELEGVRPMAELQDGHESPVWDVLSRLEDEARLELSYDLSPGPVWIRVTSIAYDPRSGRMSIRVQFDAGTILAEMVNVRIAVP